MNLGILLNLGESLTTLANVGQDRRFINHYLRRYKKNFNKIYIFSYEKEKCKLPKNCFLVTNHFSFHRFLYTFLMPILHFREFKQCDILRVTHLLGSIPAIITKIFYGKKFIVTYGYDYKKFSQIESRGYLVPFIALIEKLAFKFADGVIVTTKPIQTYISHRVKKEKIFYIPNGVDIDKFKVKSQKLKVKDGRIKILFVGRLEKQKNLFTLIKAISLLQLHQAEYPRLPRLGMRRSPAEGWVAMQAHEAFRRKPNLSFRNTERKPPASLPDSASLWQAGVLGEASLKEKKQILLKFIGDGSLQGKLSKYAKEKRVNLEIIKKVAYDKMPSVYQGADIFVLPSLIEGHPKVLLEAMACGLACIGNNIESINTIIEDKKNGLIFHNSAGSLSQVLQRVLDGSSRVSRLGLNARKFIIKNLDFEELIKKEIKILKSL